MNKDVKEFLDFLDKEDEIKISFYTKSVTSFFIINVGMAEYCKEHGQILIHSFESEMIINSKELRKKKEEGYYFIESEGKVKIMIEKV